MEQEKGVFFFLREKPLQGIIILRVSHFEILEMENDTWEIQS